MSKTTEERSYSHIRKSIEKNDPRWIFLNCSKTLLSEKELSELCDLLKSKKNTHLLRITWSTQQTFPDTLLEEIHGYLKRNYEKFQVWPTDLELALLSSHVYGPVSEGSKVEGIPNTSEEFVLLKNWSVYEVFEDEVSGYFGVLYKRDHQWVLAHRGTDHNLSSGEEIQDLIKKLKETAKDVQTDIDSIVKIKITRQQQKGYESTLKAQKYVDQWGGTLSITGHSLGGWLAQLSAFYIHHKHQTKGHPFKMMPHTVIFDAPSARAMIQKLYLKPNLEQLLDKFDMRLYLSAPNPINCCGGIPIAKEILRLYPEVNALPIHPYLVYAGEKLQQMENWKEKLFKLMGENAISKYCKKMVNSVTDIPNDLITDLKVLNTHLLIPLITTFNKETGQPNFYQYKVVQDWPSIHFKAKKKETNSLLDKLLTNLGVPDLLKPAIQSSIDDLPITGMANILVDWLTGDIDQDAYREFYQYTNETEGYEVNVETLKDEKRFKLLYKAHYDTIKPEFVKTYVKSLPSIQEVYIHDFLKSLQALPFNDPYLTHLPEFKTLKDQYILEKDGRLGERYFKELKGGITQFYNQIYRTILLYPFSAKQLSEDVPFESTQLLQNDVQIQPEQPLTVETLLKEGDFHLEEGDFKNAIEQYSQVIELDSKYAEAYLKRARAMHLLNKKSCGEMKQDLEQWIQLELETSKNSSIQTIIGHLEENAFKTYVLWVSQSIAEEVFKAAEIKLKQGRYEEAIQSYDQVIRLNPEFAKAYFQRGIGRERLYQETLKDLSCQYKELTQSYNETHSIDLEFKSSCENWKHLQESVQLQKAIEDYTHVIKLDSKLSEAYYRRAKAKFTLNRLELNEDITRDLKDFVKCTKLETPSFQKLLKERSFYSHVDDQFKIVLYKTFLLHVVEEDDDVLLKKMHEQGIPLNLVNEKGRNLYLMIALKGSQKALEYCRQNIKESDFLDKRDQEGNGAFHLAAMHNQTHLIPILQNHIDINQKNKLGQTVVHLCAFHGQSDFFKLLLKFKPELQEEAVVIFGKEPFYFTPIQIAVAMGHQKMIELLFESHVNCQKLHKELGTLLHIAIHFNKVHLFDVLINKLNISPDLLNSKGLNALSYAALRNEVPFMEVLVKYIKDQGGDINTQDEFGRVPLHYAVEKLNIKAIQYLVKIGVLISLGDKKGNIPWQLAKNTVAEMKDEYERTKARFKLNLIYNLFYNEAPFKIEIKDILQNDQTKDFAKQVSLTEFLSRVFFKENEECVKVLENFSETLSFQSLLRKLEGTPQALKTSLVREFLFYVAEIGDLTQLQALYDKAFPLNLDNEEGIHKDLEVGRLLGLTYQDSTDALHLAAKYAQRHLVSTFKSLGIDMRGKNALGQTVVHVCALHGKFHFLVELIEQGLRPNLEEEAWVTIENENAPFEFSPIQIAVAQGNKDVMNLLKSQGAHSQIKHQELGSLLHIAIRFNRQKLFDDLLNKLNLDLSETNEKGITALSYAVLLDKKRFFAEALIGHIKHGGNINQPDKFGRTALHYAAGKFDDELVEFLIKSGMISSIVDGQGHTPLEFMQNQIQEMEKKSPLKAIELKSINKIKLLLSNQAFQVSSRVQNIKEPFLIPKLEVIDPIETNTTKVLTLFDSLRGVYAYVIESKIGLALSMLHTSQQNDKTPLYKGAWDREQKFDFYTGEPLFTLRLFDEKHQEVGSTVFYKHPLLCRSELGDRHNIISAQGVLASVLGEIERVTREGKLKDYVENTCQGLPPTLWENFKQTAINGIINTGPHGVIRGMAQVSTYALQEKGVSQEITQKLHFMVYYGSLFLWQYLHHYMTLPQEIPEIQRILTAAYQAAWDLGALIITNFMIHQVCRFFGWLAQKLESYEWHRMAKLSQGLSDYGAYGCYGYQWYNQGLVKTGVNLLTGTVVEKIVKETGKRVVDRCLKVSELGFFGSNVPKESGEENKQILEYTN